MPGSVVCVEPARQSWVAPWMQVRAWFTRAYSCAYSGTRVATGRDCSSFTPTAPPVRHSGLWPNFKEKLPMKVYQIKVSLNEIKPSIWRRFLVKDTTTLPALHKILQTVMGWTNSHLHHFVVDGEVYSEPDEDNEIEYIDYRKTRISDVMDSVNDEMTYEYDFGDGWEHTLILEKVIDSDPDMKDPVCLAGERNCPPEDCGGAYGFMEILKNLNHEEYETWKTWVGEEYDSERFDINMVNRLLQRRNYGLPSW